MESAITNQGRVKEYVLEIELLEKESIMGYTGGKRKPFLKITVALPKHVPVGRSMYSFFIQQSNDSFSYIGIWLCHARIWRSFFCNF